MIREINVSEITAAVKEMCIQANHFLSPDMDKALKAATANEESPLGKGSHCKHPCHCEYQYLFFHILVYPP